MHSSLSSTYSPQVIIEFTLCVIKSIFIYEMYENMLDLSVFRDSTEPEKNKKHKTNVSALLTCKIALKQHWHGVLVCA